MALSACLIGSIVAMFAIAMVVVYVWVAMGWLDGYVQPPRLFTHQRLDLAGLHRHAAGDQFAALVRDQRVVLDADADVPVGLGHVVGGRT